MDYSVILASLIVFLVLIIVLVAILLGAKAKLVPSGPVTLKINGEKCRSFLRRNPIGYSWK